MCKYHCLHVSCKNLSIFFPVVYIFFQPVDKLTAVSMVNKWTSFMPLDGFAVCLNKNQYNNYPVIVYTRGGTIPEITMRYVSRYLSHDTIHITILH